MIPFVFTFVIGSGLVMVKFRYSVIVFVYVCVLCFVSKALIPNFLFAITVKVIDCKMLLLS